MKRLLALALLLDTSPIAADAPTDHVIMQPRVVVEIYTFLGSEAAKTRLLSFEDKPTGYTLKQVDNGKIIGEDIHYRKTFGGRSPSPTIHVVNARYVIYPSTVPVSRVANTPFHDMMAITHVFDMKRGKLLHSSKPYQYDHDIPLRYDVEAVLLLGLLEEAHDKDSEAQE